MEQNDSNIILTPEAGSEHKGLRLDKFLALTVPDVSRSQVQRLAKLSGSAVITTEDLPATAMSGASRAQARAA